MKKRMLLMIAIAVAVLAIPTAAFAKGPTVAVITGSGIKGGSVTLRGMGEPGSGAKLGDLAEQTGLFSAMFGAASDGQILPVKPTVGLGAHYVVVYTIPNDDPKSAKVTMDLYPYAPGGPVTYTRPGPPVFSGQEPLAGQWFQGPPDLRDLLVSVGLPDRAALPGFIVLPQTVAPYVPPVAAAPQPVAQTPVKTTSPGPGPWIALVVVAMTVIMAVRQFVQGRRGIRVAVAG
jgi:hypothetical protein